MRSIFLMLSLFSGCSMLHAEPINLAILGDGLLPVQSFDDTIAYVKSGKFAVNGDGDLVVMSNGLRLAGYWIDTAGNASDKLAGINLIGHGKFEFNGSDLNCKSFSTNEMRPCYRIPVAHFKDETLLTPAGGGLFFSNSNSGAVSYSAPNPGAGEIIKGASINSDNLIHLAVQGNGFLILSSDSGDQYFAREVSLLFESGGVTTAEGYRLQGKRMEIDNTVAASLSSLAGLAFSWAPYLLRNDGTLFLAGTGYDTIAVYQIPVATFVGVDFLTRLSNGYYVPNAKSGAAQIGQANASGRGEVVVR